MQLIANVTLMFTERALPDRIQAAVKAGFDGVEIQFPYEVEAAALRKAGGEVPIVLINAPASDPRGGNGRATDAALVAEFAAGIEEAAHYAQVLGVRKVNVLPGPPPPGQDEAVTRRTLKANLKLAADRLQPLGVAVVTEAINPYDMPGFYLDGLGKSLTFLEELADPRIALQFDFYHMARTEPDLAAAVIQAGSRMGHVQFADHPGRHEPGTGGIDFAAAFAALRATGYRDAVAAEYRPAGATEAGLSWMEHLRTLLPGDN